MDLMQEPRPELTPDTTRGRDGLDGRKEGIK